MRSATDMQLTWESRKCALYNVVYTSIINLRFILEAKSDISVLWQVQGNASGVSTLMGLLVMFTRPYSSVCGLNWDINENTRSFSCVFFQLYLIDSNCDLLSICIDDVCLLRCLSLPKLEEIFLKDPKLSDILAN